MGREEEVVRICSGSNELNLSVLNLPLHPHFIAKAEKYMGQSYWIINFYMGKGLTKDS